MKKIFLPLLTIACTIMLFSACSKNPSKVLPRKDGIWSYTVTTVDLTGTSTDAGKMTFTTSGVVITPSSSGGLAVTGTWSYDKTGKKLTLTIGGSSSIYSVTDYTRSKETWTSSESGTTETIKLTKD